MIENLKKFREELFDSYAYKEKNDVLLGIGGDRLYKECKMEELPVKFQESIKEHMKTGTGMGSGLNYDNANYFFSNTADGSLHKCFKKVDKIPQFKVKINDFMFENVKKFTEENNLEIRCNLGRVVDNENILNGCVYVNLYSQEYFEKENETGIEEMDEYFFWKGGTKKSLLLPFAYELKNVDNIDRKELKKEIISFFKQGKKEIFSDKWEIG